MNFIDRITLGKTLARKLERYRDKGAVIICLQESSLLTCLTMAQYLRAWVYPLVFEPVYSNAKYRSAIGAYDQDGHFCALRQIGDADDSGEDIEAVASQHKSAAMKSIKKQLADYDLRLDKQVLNGRDVIIAADVVTDPLPLVVAERLLKQVHPKSLTAVVANATPEVAQLVRLTADRSDITDILSGTIFDPSHYFERPDSYTSAEKFSLTNRIATYWK